MRKLALSFVALFLGVGLLHADMFTATITKVEGHKITLHKGKKGDKGAAITLTAAKGVNVYRAKYDKDDKKFEKGQEIEKGLRADLFDRDVFARITTNKDDKVTEILVIPAKKK